MSEENVEAVQQAYEGANERLEFPKELFDRDWELDLTEVSSEDVAVVRVTTREAFCEYWEMFERFHIELEQARAVSRYAGGSSSCSSVSRGIDP
jgi:hypothetical protein